MYKHKIIKSPNIYKIKQEFYLKNNIRYILCDLDNTLDSFDCKNPSIKTLNLVKLLKENNIKLIICSNNKKKRVESYANCLNVDFVYRCFKPFKYKINKYLNKHSINKNECILIGDQFNTDVKCAIKLGIKVIFCEELVNKNALISKINKKLEKLNIKKAYKKDMIIKMEEIYVNK